VNGLNGRATTASTPGIRHCNAMELALAGKLIHLPWSPGLLLASVVGSKVYVRIVAMQKINMYFYNNKVTVILK